MNWRRRFQPCSTSSLVIAIAIAWATTACTAVTKNTHGARCATCLKELYYSYQQHQKGKTATQIRAGIIKGEWKQIDLQSAAVDQLIQHLVPST
jgi:predicted metal-binding membrane protein